MQKLFSKKLKTLSTPFLLNRHTSRHYFSITSPSNPPKPSSTSPSHSPLTDYQYIKLIQQNLFNNNVNQALKYLIRSNLDGLILDMHIYRFFFIKVCEMKMSLSYQEIAYKLYRENFKPNILMYFFYVSRRLDWMNSLARSSNQKIRSLLEEDFKGLKIEMPKVQTIQQQQQQIKKSNTSSVNMNNIKSNSVTEHKSHHVAIPKPKQSQILATSPSSPSQASQVSPTSPTPSLQTSDLYPQKLQANQIAALRNIISSIMQNKPKITLHNIEIIYDEGEQLDGLDYEQEDQYQMGLRTQNKNNLSGSSSPHNMNNPHNKNSISHSHHRHQPHNQYENNTSSHNNEQQELSDEDDDYSEMISNSSGVSRIKIGRIEIDGSQRSNSTMAIGLNHGSSREARQTMYKNINQNVNNNINNFINNSNNGNNNKEAAKNDSKDSTNNDNSNKDNKDNNIDKNKDNNKDDKDK